MPYVTLGIAGGNEYSVNFRYEDLPEYLIFMSLILLRPHLVLMIKELENFHSEERLKHLGCFS